MQLHLHLDMHFLQSESFGLPLPPQSHRWMQLALELPPQRHRAMQRSTGTHEGQPHFICLRMQSLHWLPSYEHARAGEIISQNSSSTTTKIGTTVDADCLFSIRPLIFILSFSHTLCTWLFCWFTLRWKAGYFIDRFSEWKYTPQETKEGWDWCSLRLQWSATDRLWPPDVDQTAEVHEMNTCIVHLI